MDYINIVPKSVHKIGHSLGLTIPKQVVEDLGMSKGSEASFIYAREVKLILISEETISNKDDFDIEGLIYELEQLINILKDKVKTACRAKKDSALLIKVKKSPYSTKKRPAYYF